MKIVKDETKKIVGLAGAFIIVMKAVMNGVLSIKAGAAELVAAGGTEVMQEV